MEGLQWKLTVKLLIDIWGYRKLPMQFYTIAPFLVYLTVYSILTAVPEAVTISMLPPCPRTS